MPSFKITNKAREDLIGIARYTEATWGRDQRRLCLQRLDSGFHALADNPSLGRKCDEIRQNYYKYPEGSHIIFFRFGAGSDIEIIRILHRRMDVASHF
ncbi:MAG: type II toxin-antitoxin system RelE/ParE family toxin [Pseudomonadota bacterium]